MGNEPSKSTDPARRARRWFRYSLRSLLVAMTIFGLWLGFKVHAAREQANAVAALRAMGVWVDYDYLCDENGSRLSQQDDPFGPAKAPEGYGAPFGPQWLTNLVGVDFFNKVVRIEVRRAAEAKNSFKHISCLPGLRTIILRDATSRTPTLNSCVL